MGYEDHVTETVPDNLFKISRFWKQIRTCINIKVLPDELQKAGISWKYYAEPDQLAERHAGHRPHLERAACARTCSDPTQFVDDIQAGQDAVGVVAGPAGALQRTPRQQRQRLRRRELDRAAHQRGDAQPSTGSPPRSSSCGTTSAGSTTGQAAALRRDGPRAADAGADHLAVHEAAGTTPKAATWTTPTTSSRRCWRSSRRSSGSSRSPSATSRPARSAGAFDFSASRRLSYNATATCPRTAATDCSGRTGAQAASPGPTRRSTGIRASTRARAQQAGSLSIAFANACCACWTPFWLSRA